MPALVTVSTDGGDVLFQGEISEGGLEEIGVQDRVDDVVRTTGTSMRALVDTIRNTTGGLVAAFDAVPTATASGGRLSSAVVELGLSVTGEGNIAIVKGTAEANIAVTLTWDFV